MSERHEQLKLLFQQSADKQDAAPQAEIAKAGAPAVIAEAASDQQQTKPTVQAHTAASDRTSSTSEDENAMQESTKPADFESMIAELEKVVTTLEGELKLEQALVLFEKGLGLSQRCERFLKSAQQRVEILKRAANGDVTTEPFAEEADIATT